MTKIKDWLQRIIQELEEEQIQFALIGAVAVAIRAIERTTKELDFVTAVESDKEAEDIVRTI